MYPIHRFDVNSVTLSKSPLDDYQRLYFGTLLSYSQERQPNVDIKSVSYKSNVAELFRQGKGNTLDCYEYSLPDVRNGMQQNDVMRGLSSLPRIGENQRNAAEMCREELEFITTKAFYDGHSLERRRRRHSSGGELDQNTNKQGGPAAYSDLHWNGISRDLKRQLVETYRNHLIHSGVPFAEASKVSLSDVMQRIRGGYIKIQGTWLPLDMAKLICTWFCFPIRYLLVPIFGPDFPQLCENARNHGFKRNDFEMVHPLQNLFEQPKTRSMSWTPGMTQREPTVAGNSSERYPERLPPISTIIDSITVDNYGYDRREPTVQTLSNLASFYNTHGHRYSYPGVHATQRQWRRPSWEDVRRPSMESTRSSGSIGWEHEFTYAPEKTSPRITDGAITDRFNERRPIPNDWRRPDQRNSREWRAQEGGS
ncbi:ZYRO0D02728p [Zygosaccharomyces rouxii]|uniref:ZYRO0D02728p n=1 Tax=Zygosaccharomyces rouxii (strain ATCC 2623 / CBS 732 / NBRC 1130 / NCYC 568 / NRRL Y-229) TaxID=559307 RepID=C5DUZ8_ZYGRC|nr:uncharacterized protein ZYRO0D02728g [Zygosaccharomyces rouxii]CAR27617.1 ZYRO0D02728p [Zygosaccharomyces rouxii]